VIGDNIAATITARSLTDIETSFNGMVQGRLTLTTAVPVTTADVTGATTVYFTPYGGNHIALYDGSAWQLYTFSELSLALGTITSDLPYDVFIYNNAGTLTLELLAWTSKTARATVLVLQDGVLSKTGALTRRYLGTFHTTATTTTEDSAVKRLLWNYYNRVTRMMYRQESAGSWAYTTATIRQANANAANQLAVVIGVSEDAVRVNLDNISQNTNTGVSINPGIGFDSITVFSANTFFATMLANGDVSTHVDYANIPAAGYHYYSWLEYSAATGTTTWRGSTSSWISALVRA
jgi:hypothetical protein